MDPWTIFWLALIFWFITSSEAEASRRAAEDAQYESDCRKYGEDHVNWPNCPPGGW